MRKRAGLYIGLNLIAALILVYFFSYYSREQMPGQNTRSVKRFNGIMKSMYEIADNTENKTLFFGTSIFQYFLHPRHFDNHLKDLGIESKSYNLAFEGLVGPGQLALVSRLESEFEKRNAHFRASVFELSPVCLNRRFYDWHREMLDFTLPAIFIDSNTWAKMFIKDAPSTSYLWFDQFFRPASWPLRNPIGDFLGYSRADMADRWSELVLLWENRKFMEFPAWNPYHGGLSNWNFPETKHDFDLAIAELHKPDNWEKMSDLYVRANNVDGTFAYSERVVDAFIESVNSAAKFSKRVYLVILPYSPSLQKHADKFVDYEFIKKKFEKSTAATIVDLRQAFPVTDANFADAMHPDHPTMDRYMKILADRIAGTQ